MSRLDTKAFGLKKTSRRKAFVFRFVSVPANLILTARQYVLNIYTEKRAYARPFTTGFGKTPFLVDKTCVLPQVA